MTITGNIVEHSGSLSTLPKKSLLLAHASTRCFIPLQLSVFDHASHLKDEFITSISPPSQQDVSQVEGSPRCVEELVARFLAFLVSKVEDSAGKEHMLNQEILLSIFRHFVTQILHNNDIHTVTAALPIDQHARESVIRNYYEAISVSGWMVETLESNFLRTARHGEAIVYTIFGGQGNNENYFDELRDLYTTYARLLAEFIAPMSGHLDSLSKLPEARQTYSRGLDPLRWLLHPHEQPSVEYLLASPLSFPLIGMLQLSFYYTTCKILGVSPKFLRDSFRGLSGHSQGLIIAVIVSKADSWESFFDSSATALSVLFWIGLRSQQVFPQTEVLPSQVQDSVKNGEGNPSPMLSVRDLPENVLQQQIDSANQFLPPGKKVAIGLFNSDSNFVVSGPTTSLCGLNSALRKIKNPQSSDQTRVPFSERKLNFTNVFLPTTAPYHSPYLLTVFDLVYKDIDGLSISRDDLQVPVYNTKDGIDLRNCNDANILPMLIQLMTSAPLHWKSATAFAGATHIVDFGPGGSAGIGLLTQQIKEGQGIRAISATTLGTHASSSSMGTKEELFDRDPQSPMKYATDWLTAFGPSVKRNYLGQPFLETKFSKLLGLPPVMVAGMTPCTVPWDFVAATMNAGYHIELAGGGYYNPQYFADAIRNVVRSVPPGRGVTLNLIYVNPSAMAWQIPLIRRLRMEGIPIDGLTIGAGIPSLEVANEYIKTLGLRHISFKPGSVAAIHEVIRIAKSNPDFPLILQWTGGRGGGHHSFEDFHQPLLQTYGKIRDCSNIILVAGSGFGDAEDSFPYLCGSWASEFKRAPMPVDGILLGSRMMVAKEAHTSRQAKEAIVEIPGVDDSSWEGTYKGSSGGVMTVLSEMREPIHKVATRGVRFWSEMDKMIFNLDRSSRVSVLQKNRDYIIGKLNADFQKVWFGKNVAGDPVDVEEMTYLEVLNRLAELLYVSSQSRWIDVSYKALLADFSRRVEERFTLENKSSLVQNFSDIQDPSSLINKINEIYPRCSRQFVTAQDAQFFLGICQRRGQKPVPFIPALDENFEFYFKKDSLWQSEDIDAVVGKDVGRIAILQGPVAAKYAKIADEPVKEILDGICAKHMEALWGITNGFVKIEAPGQSDDQSSPETLTPEVQTPARSPSYDVIIHQISHSTHANLPSTDAWIETLAGDRHTWRQAFFRANSLIQGQRRVENPLKRLFAPSWNIEVTIENPHEPRRMVVKLKEAKPHPRDVIWLKATSEMNVDLIIVENMNALELPVELCFKFVFNPEANYAAFQEVMQGRNDRIKDFYWSLWFGREEKLPKSASLTDVFQGGVFEVQEQEVSNFVQALNCKNEAYFAHPGMPRLAPLDFAIKAAWKAITKPLFLIDGNLLDLVHLSNEFQTLPGADPVNVGDVLGVTSHVRAVRILNSGKMVEVCGTIKRGTFPIIKVTSRFLFRGPHSNTDHLFERKSETPVLLHLKSARDVTLLLSKEWFDHHPEIDLLDKHLLFRPDSVIQYRNQDEIESVETRGTVWLSSDMGEAISNLGRIDYAAGPSAGNPVTDYLSRYGYPLKRAEAFENPGLLNGPTPLSFQAPASNELYSSVSGDFNPIHTSRAFASYSGLPGTIVHGMHLSAIVRGLTETCAADGDPGLIKTFDCSFDGMVLPDDHINVRIWHVGMKSGRKVVKVEATKDDAEKVLSATAEIGQPTSAYLFTGQGSQVQGMGMDLYAENEAARNVWNRADTFLRDNYGKILHLHPMPCSEISRSLTRHGQASQ